MELAALSITLFLNGDLAKYHLVIDINVLAF